jgi:hypothetical protein
MDIFGIIGKLPRKSASRCREKGLRN